MISGLRLCAGVLSDLVETAPRLGQVGKPAPVDCAGEATPVQKEEAKKESQEEKEEESSKEEARGSKDRPRRKRSRDRTDKKRRDRKKERKRKEESSCSGEKAPASSSRKERKSREEVKAKEEPESSEDEEESRRKRSGKVKEERSRTPVLRETHRECKDEEDREEEINPGASVLPIRLGRGETVREEARDEPADLRPREPSHPPPRRRRIFNPAVEPQGDYSGHYGDEAWSYKKSKGKKHRERGHQRNLEQRQREEQWRRKQRRR